MQLHEQTEKRSAISTGRVASVQVGKPRQMTDEKGAWESAIFKVPVTGPVWVGTINLNGDEQANLKVHGGPDQAVLAYCAAHYDRWREELGKPDFPFGAFGENLTVEGFDEGTVCLGDVFEAGDAVLQVTSPRGPCWKIARKHAMPKLTAMVQKTGRTGWYYRVLQEGEVEAGRTFALVERPNPEWTIDRTAKVSLSRDPEMLRELVALPELAERFRELMEDRLRKYE